MQTAYDYATTVSEQKMYNSFGDNTNHYPPLECTQNAGDVMFVPTLWGHATLNTMQSIGVAHEFSVESFCME
jgi:hypothetical protein